MKTLLFATGNDMKFKIASTTCLTYDIEIQKIDVKTDEIQSEDMHAVVADKARRAFEVLKQPVVVSDDSWTIPALNGFPGPYMKSMNHWFTTNDFLLLMQDKTDRTIFLHQNLGYYDGITEAKFFSVSTKGTILHEPRGLSNVPVLPIVAMDDYNNQSVAEVEAISSDEAQLNDVWKQFAEWYKNY